MAALNKRSYQERIDWRKNDWTYKCKILGESYASLHRPFYIRMGEQQIPENLVNGGCFTLYEMGNTWKLWKVVL